MSHSAIPSEALFGLGMRSPHYPSFLDGSAPVDFVEVISENFMGAGGRPLDVLERVRGHYPMALHGVSMSIGRTDGLDPLYLTSLKALADRIEPLWVSDHLCWTGTGGVNTHDLLPLPYTCEALRVVSDNIQQAQDALGRPLLIENPSSYVQFEGADMSEWEFMAQLAYRTGCYILLDVNNVFVSAANHGFDPIAYLDGIPAQRVRQIHLAGHSEGRDGLLIDTHDHDVPVGVWDLYAEAVRRLPPVATMIERDDEIPPLTDLLAEMERARSIASATPLLAAA